MTASRHMLVLIGLLMLAGAEGSALAAKGKNMPAVSAAGVVTASSVHPGNYAASLAVDGDAKTRWASAVGGGVEWIQIDFGKSVSVSGVNIYWETARAADYKVQMSDDGKDWKTLREAAIARGQNVDPKTEKDSLVDLKGSGRYFRLLCTRAGAHNLYSIWEIEFTDKETAQVLAGLVKPSPAAGEKPADDGSLKKELLATGLKDIIFAIRQPGKDGHWYANFSYWSYDANSPLYGPGGKLCRMNLESGEVKALLDDKEGGVRDPVVHYDGKKILFSYRKGGSEFYHLYEIDADGKNLRQLTDGPFDDVEPSYLPDDRIVFVSTRCKRWVNCWLTKVAVLHTCSADGTNIRAISANIEQDNTPWPLPDGRILYQRWEYIDRSQVDYHHLWTAYPDGTSQMVFYGNQQPGIVMIDAKPIADTDKVIAVFSPGHGRREHDGTLVVLDVKAGPDARTDAERITREQDYRDPWAFSESLFMAVRGGREIVLLDAQGHENAIYRLGRSDGVGMECHEPRPLMSRPRERVIPPRADLQQSTGTLMLADVYQGRNMAGVNRGDIKKLLVLESLPKPVNFTGGMDPLTYGGSFTLERVLGTVPVEADGSAYMELPAMRSLFLVALDANNFAVKRMQSFLTVQPGENTGCVGCHEQRTQTISPSLIQAVSRKPSRIEPIAGVPDVYDFPRDVQPILDKLCVDCHDYAKTPRGGPYAGKVVLSGDHGPMFSHAYFSMKVSRLYTDNHNRAVSNYPPRTLYSADSRILRMLDGSHYGVKADQRQKTILRLWIETGGPYPGTYAALGNGAIGGYIKNNQVNCDKDWPTSRAGAEAMNRRCNSCHAGKTALPRSMCDELGMSFWRFDLNDPHLKFSRHIVFNLSRPDKSLLLLAPLAEKSGGLGLCRTRDGKPADVFADAADADYLKLLAMVNAGKENLEKIKRFDMPGFQPVPGYLREMRHYGILPADQPDTVPVNPYELDRKYWQSLWYQTPGSQ